MKYAGKYVDTEDLTLEMLNEIWGIVNVCGFDWEAGYLLLKVDRVAFRQAELDYIDGLVSDGILVEVEDGEYVWKDDYESESEQ